MDIQTDKNSGLALALGLPETVSVIPDFPPKEGTVVAMGIVSSGSQPFPHKPGAILLGVLGSRMTGEGIAGYAPYRADVGEVLHLLDDFGVVGRWLPDLSDQEEPPRVRILGSVAVGGCPLVVDLAKVEKTPSKISLKAVPA